jgi:uncharacterized phiE125 gp8 family phage protein
MWYPPKVTQAPEEEPVSLDEAKDHAHIDAPDDDEAIKRLIASARAHVENYCGIALATQTVEVKCDGFSDMARLPVAPVQSVMSIGYVDAAGADQTVAASVYELRADGLEAAIALKHGQSWPSTQPGSRITLIAVVGYETVPPDVKHALLLFISSGDLNRENVKAEGWTAFDSLLCNNRRSL